MGRHSIRVAEGSTAQKAEAEKVRARNELKALEKKLRKQGKIR